MSTQTQLANDEIYHVVLRGVGDSIIFNNEDDYYRGVFSIYEFNDINPTTIRERRARRIRFKKTYRGQTSVSLASIDFVDTREKMVDILAFCFMPNHVHLLLRQSKDNGISQFMQKLGTGYAVYFNKKYNRKGHLFNKFKAIYIKDDDQLKNVFVYIHANPASLVEPGWKEAGIKNSKETIKLLENYKWSSYQDYLDKKNFPSVTKREFLLGLMDGIDGCRQNIEAWIKHKEGLKNFDSVVLE